MRIINIIIACLLCCLMGSAKTYTVINSKNASPREQYASEYLHRKLTEIGYTDISKGAARTTEINTYKVKGKPDIIVYLKQSADTAGLKKEGYTIVSKGNKVYITGNDGTGVIYGCCALVEHLHRYGNADFSKVCVDAPEMVMRGACIGMQKTEYLPGHNVYEYPYTPQTFPWFYDKAAWIKYLDMLVDDRMNSLYLWNGHPFSSLVRLKDYPFAVEVDDSTFKKNEEMYTFLTKEAGRRGISVIQMFYNIILSKPFADHYGLKTQDRHRGITPLISDYTRKSIAAFIEKYPNVGLLVCLGEAMDTYEDDVQWFTKTIIPGVKDGLKALGRTDEPPIILRAHDTDSKMVLDAALPLYRNIYTMQKYNGESLTTYQPQGPWAEEHRYLASLGAPHIENVHILANLEPWRWSAPDFIQKSVMAMHNIHHANSLHLYPQASYWDWPYTADKLPDGKRLLQIDRDKMWFAAWGRYAWNCNRDHQDEVAYWDQVLGDDYGLSYTDASKILEAYEQSGEIAPKTLRRFGITEGNRQTLLLGMFMSQLVNPYKYTVYPEFYASCGPTGEKLIEYVEKEWKHQPHVGELPLDIVSQIEAHGDKAVAAIDAVADKVTKNKDEFSRLRNDMHCYREFAYAFGYKVKAAQHVLNYRWGKDISELDVAVPLMEKSLEYYRKLVDLTKDSYLYANSMQTSQRRIPIGGDGGKYKTWIEMLPRYEMELANLKKNIAILKLKAKGDFHQETKQIKALTNAKVMLDDSVKTVKLAKGVRLFDDLDSVVTDVAPELTGMNAIVFNSKHQKEEGTRLDFTSAKDVSVLVGYFRDDQIKYAAAPKLEVDATANDYGQAEPQLFSALKIKGMPQINVHKYNLKAGHNTLLLPKGYLMVLGFTSDNVVARNVGIEGSDDAIDWLFY